MKRFSKLLVLLVILAMLVGCFASCDKLGDLLGQDSDNSQDQPGDTTGEKPDDGGNGGNENDPPVPPAEFVDYAAQMTFNKNSGRAWLEVTVKTYVDGDTTHFNVPENLFEEGTLKARYLGINTPESTGVIEPWGKKASNYTKTQLMKATSIIIESDTATWNVDSTGGRYLVWVWYKTSESDVYRNLNVEILQQGLAFGSNAASNSYSTYTMGALNQAKNNKYHVFSKEKDPDFYYGGAVTLTLKELKANIEKYSGILVRFEAVVAKCNASTIYVEEYDAENDMYFGMQIFPGYNCNIMDYFNVGNRVAIVGTVQYYETGGTWQIANLQSSLIRPNDPQYCNLISVGEHSAAYRELTAEEILTGKVMLETIVEKTDETTGEVVEEKVTKEFDYAEIAHYSTVTVKNLTVKSVKTTQTGSSAGALTLICESPEGIEISVRFDSKFKWEDDSVIVADDFPAGTVISARGIIDYFDYNTSDSTPGQYQIRSFSIGDITIERE